MKSESVTKAWEFYRDNCQGFKEPMRKEFRKLDEYVAGLESENAKLRELVRHALTFCVNGYCSEYEGCMWTIDGRGGCLFADRAKKLGIEVSDG